MSEHDERKMKELAERLVAMSPEPPPYPGEVSASRREPARPRPALVFAGAALAVLLLAAIPFLLSRGGGEVPPAVTSTTAVPSTTVTTVAENTTTTVPSTTTTQPATTTTVAPQPADAVLYLVQSPENSFLGNPALVPFAGVVTVGADPAHPALPGLQALGDPGLVVPEGFTNMVPAGVEVVGVSFDEHSITLDMNEAFLAGGGGLLADFTMLNQLIFTATQFGEIETVQFTVGGEPVTAFGSEGIDLTDPVGRDTFLDQVNLVNLDSPLIGQGDDPLVVSGLANVFEATVSLEVVDAAGNVVYEDFTNATCGTGCWGGYSFTVDYPFAGGETVRVFWHSPEDGSPSDVVSVPVLWDDPDGWPLLP